MERGIASQLRERVGLKISDATTQIYDVIDKEIGMEIATIFRGALEFATSTYDFVQDLVNNPAKDRGEINLFLEHMIDCIAGYTAYLRENLPERADASTKKEILAEIDHGTQYYKNG
jgi:hypothetical protein